jgi:hypothetical protein
MRLFIPEFIVTLDDGTLVPLSSLGLTYEEWNDWTALEERQYEIALEEDTPEYRAFEKKTGKSYPVRYSYNRQSVDDYFKYLESGPWIKKENDLP